MESVLNLKVEDSILNLWDTNSVFKVSLMDD